MAVCNDAAQWPPDVGLEATDLEVTIIHGRVGDFTVDQNVKVACASGAKGEELMVLGSAPRVILMDEPTAGMTPEETRRTVRFVRSLGDRDIAVIIIEHDMSFVREIDSKITVLHQGSVFREGPLQQIERDADMQRISMGEGDGGDAARS